MLHIASTVVQFLVVAGVLTRKTPRIHLRFMVTAFLVDFGLVLYIETTRHAVEQFVAGPSPLLWFHAGVSLLVLMAYIGQFMLGRRMLAGVLTNRRTHIAMGIAFCSLRSINYVTSFML